MNWFNRGKDRGLMGLSSTPPMDQGEKARELYERGYDLGRYERENGPVVPYEIQAS